MANKPYFLSLCAIVILIISIIIFYFSCQRTSPLSTVTVTQTSKTTEKPKNPPISVRLDKIGVYDNREDFTRGQDGEIYIYAAMYDGKNPTQKLRFPQAEGQHYKLSKNETVSVNSVIFSVGEVGNNLGLTIIGFEDDGGGYEPLVYKALGAALEYQLSAQTKGISELFDLNLAGLVGKFAGEADDYLGTFERTWDRSSNWGVGTYTDISCQDERGVSCLRVWFSISSK
jgi:hypothetical protein